MHDGTSGECVRTVLRPSVCVCAHKREKKNKIVTEADVHYFIEKCFGILAFNFLK